MKNRLKRDSDSRHDISEIRSVQRYESIQYNDNSVYLPNPSASAPIDRHTPQDYESKMYGLGMEPNVPDHFWQLLKGDVGSGRSVFRVAELFQSLGAELTRTSATPYSKAIALASDRSRDQRPRYFQASLFSVGRVIRTTVPIGPLPTSEISRFGSGIPSGTPSLSGNTQFGIPQFSTTQFRVMINDESGQRFFDVDVMGTRTISAYGFGMTVFALIKDDGYEIDRQRDDNPQLGPGLIDQSIVGSRVIPIRSNITKNISNRTVTINTPGGGANPTVVPIPPGARNVQGYSSLPAGGASVFFATVDPLNPVSSIDAAFGSQGFMDFTGSPNSNTDTYDISNSNAIVILNTGEIVPFSGTWQFVFEVTT